MLEIIQVAAKEVRVPEADVERGMATANRSQDLQSAGRASDWLVIMSPGSPPNSSLRIQYHDHWFYIDDTDPKSRETFAMLTALFAVVGGTVPVPIPS